MESLISSKIYITNPTQAIIDYAENNLVFDNPQYAQNIALGHSNYKTPKKIYLYQNLGNKIILPFGCLKEIWGLIKNSPYTLDFKVVETQKKYCLLDLREYQKNALETLKKEKGGVLVAPCGSGKTLVGLNLANEVNQKTLWIAHTKDLVNQAKETYMQHFGIIHEGDIGTIIEGQVNVGDVITFATIQTLANMDLTDYKYTWNTIIVDECHRIASKPMHLTMYDNVLGKLSARYKYGLTATPKRRDGLTPTIYKLVGDIAHTITDHEVNSVKVEAKLKVIESDIAESLEYYDSDYKFINYKFSDYIATHPQRNTLIVDTIINRFFDGKHLQLVLCERVEQTDLLSKKIDEYNSTSETKINYIIFNGRTRKKVRDKILKEYKTFDVILATYQIASEGLDMPSLDTLHLASPKTKNNKALIKQCVGRVERASPEKHEAIVYCYRDFNIMFSRKAVENVRLAMGIKKRDFTFMKGETR